MALALIGLVPLLLGLLFELVVVAPLRVPLDQTPLFFPWQVRIRSCVFRPQFPLCRINYLFLFSQDWALGVLHMKIICAVTMMGPNWWLKRNLEQVPHVWAALQCTFVLTVLMSLFSLLRV